MTGEIRFSLFEKRLHTLFLIVSAEALGTAFALEPVRIVQGYIVPEIDRFFRHIQSKTG